jgi:hypothetical protein
MWDALLVLVKEHRAMRTKRHAWLFGSTLVLGGVLIAAGCYNTPINVSESGRGPAPLRMPSPLQGGAACDCYEDSLTGGQIFTMYCSFCHNAPTLAERPFSNFKNVASHMRVRANLTGKEYAKLLEFLRRWHDVPPPNPPLEPSPKRITFFQPIAELQKQIPTTPAPEPAPQPKPAGEMPAKNP